jgi:predicted chitinase
VTERQSFFSWLWDRVGGLFTKAAGEPGPFEPPALSTGSPRRAETRPTPPAPEPQAAAPALPAATLTVSLSQLREIMPHLAPARAEVFWHPLVSAMHEFEIWTSTRAAAFLAQLAEESGELRWLEEIASGDLYEGRRDLGNTRPGDGQRYKGRGAIQLTGRANYRAAGIALGLDLEDSPERAKDPYVALRIAGWYWFEHGCNRLADAGDFVSITRRINGGLNDLAVREAYWATAKRVLGA